MFSYDDFSLVLCEIGKAAKSNKNNENEKPTNLPVPLEIKKVTHKSGTNVMKLPS